MSWDFGSNDKTPENNNDKGWSGRSSTGNWNISYKRQKIRRNEASPSFSFNFVDVNDKNKEKTENEIFVPPMEVTKDKNCVVCKREIDFNSSVTKFYFCMFPCNCVYCSKLCMENDLMNHSKEKCGDGGSGENDEFKFSFSFNKNVVDVKLPYEDHDSESTKVKFQNPTSVKVFSFLGRKRKYMQKNKKSFVEREKYLIVKNMDSYFENVDVLSLIDKTNKKYMEEVLKQKEIDGIINIKEQKEEESEYEKEQREIEQKKKVELHKRDELLKKQYSSINTNLSQLKLTNLNVILSIFERELFMSDLDTDEMDDVHEIIEKLKEEKEAVKYKNSILQMVSILYEKIKKRLEYSNKDKEIDSIFIDMKKTFMEMKVKNSSFFSTSNRLSSILYQISKLHIIFKNYSLAKEYIDQSIQINRQSNHRIVQVYVEFLLDLQDETKWKGMKKKIRFSHEFVGKLCDEKLFPLVDRSSYYHLTLARMYKRGKKFQHAINAITNAINLERDENLIGDFMRRKFYYMVLSGEDTKGNRRLGLNGLYSMQERYSTKKLIDTLTKISELNDFVENEELKSEIFMIRAWHKHYQKRIDSSMNDILVAIQFSPNYDVYNKLNRLFELVKSKVSMTTDRKVDEEIAFLETLFEEDFEEFDDEDNENIDYVRKRVFKFVFKNKAPIYFHRCFLPNREVVNSDLWKVLDKIPLIYGSKIELVNCLRYQM